MKITINLKNQNRKIAREIFNKLFEDLKKYRRSEYNAFLRLNKKGYSLAV